VDGLSVCGVVSNGKCLLGRDDLGCRSLLARYRHLEDIPTDAKDWDVTVRGAPTLAATLASQRADAETFKLLATLRTADDWKWTGPTEDFPVWCERFGGPRLANDATALAAARGPL
jgi:hypothetical protein